MDESQYRLFISAENAEISSRATAALMLSLRETEGITNVDRGKDSDMTMDLGSIVSIVATSGATLAIAQGICAWLRARRDTTITIEQPADGSIKAICTGIDPATAVRITEIIRG